MNRIENGYTEEEIEAMLNWESPKEDTDREYKEEEKLYLVANKIHHLLIFQAGRVYYDNKLFYKTGRYRNDKMKDIQQDKHEFFVFVASLRNLVKNIVDMCINFEISSEALNRFYEEDLGDIYWDGETMAPVGYDDSYSICQLNDFFKGYIFYYPYNRKYRFDIRTKELWCQHNKDNKIKLL